MTKQQKQRLLDELVAKLRPELGERLKAWLGHAGTAFKPFQKSL